MMEKREKKKDQREECLGFVGWKRNRGLGVFVVFVEFEVFDILGFEVWRI